MFEGLMRETGISVLKIACGLLLLRAAPLRAEEPAKPPSDGLVLWLDPSADDTVTMGGAAKGDRHLSMLRDRSPAHHDAKPASPDAAPELTSPTGKRRSALRFTGREALMVDPIRSAAGGVTVFVVYAKPTGKPAPGPGGALFSSRPDAAKLVDAKPNFLIAGPDPKAPPRFIKTVALEDVPIGPITLGRDYVGEVGEVLVYDRTFTSEGERRRVLEYLQNKWEAPFPEPGWTRVGSLPPTPNRTRDDLPLSDQGNQGKWVLDPKFTDDFKGKSLDPTRYHLAHSDANDWWGREPGLFRPENVTLQNGSLNIRIDKGTPEELKGHPKYQYTTGYVRTRERTGYGYYEIEARPGKSEFDNAFWFSDTGDPKNALEIDVFELGPHTNYYHNRDIMTAHVWSENGDKHHWGSLVAYTTPWELADDFHVYALEWTQQELVWYIDGSPVRRLKNTNWHLPQYMIFDAEPMLDWFGPIDDKDFPTAFQIKYVRVWRKVSRSETR